MANSIRLRMAQLLAENERMRASRQAHFLFNREFPLGFEMMADEFARQFCVILFCHSELWQNKIA